MTIVPKLFCGFAALLVLAGCAAGSDFEEPTSPAVSSYAEGGDPTQTPTTKKAKAVQRFLTGGDVPAAWWTLFGSAPLNALIEQAVKANPTLEAARAALKNAQELAQAQRGAFFPAFSGAAEDDRQKTQTVAGPYTLYNTAVSVSYTPDVFGATRRANEAAEARAEAQGFELEAAYLALTTNLVTTAIQEASLREQIKAAKAVIEARQGQHTLTKAKLDAGAVDRTVLLSQAQTLATAQAALPALEKQLAATRHLMAVLLGRAPSEGVGATFTLDGFTLPTEVPVSLPSKLVTQRPDIRAARANLQAANAEIGLALTAMLPQFPLTASYGISAGEVANLFNPGTAVWGLGAGLLQPLFQGGELLHKKRAKEAAFDQAAATYRATVLSAFQNVADSLKALESDAATAAAQTEAERLAAQTLSLTQAQVDAGATDRLVLLSAKAARETAAMALAKAKAARLADTAALFQSLGGGWWNRKTDNGETP